MSLTQAPRRIDSRSLGEFPLDVVRIEWRCDCTGSYRRDGLVARFGVDIAFPDLLVALSACERRKDFSRPCGVRYTDLTRELSEKLGDGVSQAADFISAACLSITPRSTHS